MVTEIPRTNPEKDPIISDNDRKFVVETISLEFLRDQDSFDSYNMETDWIETNDNDEVKIVRKVYDDGQQKLLHIAKVGVDENRKSKKTELTESDYYEHRQKLDPSKTHVEKHRYEFEFEQNGIRFTAKYDEYTDSKLRVLEIDAVSKSDADRNAFDPKLFDFALVEVTGIKQFYGHRISTIVADPQSY